MRRLLIYLLLFVSTTVSGQVAKRIYKQADNLIIANADGTNPLPYRYLPNAVQQCGDYVCIRNESGGYTAYAPNQILNQNGSLYGNTSSAVITAFYTVSTGGSGTPGSPGIDGRTILSGTVAPTNGVGAVGDLYYNTATVTIYGPKNSGGWGAGVVLVGPSGQPGANGTNGTNGANGVDGRTIIYGTSAPSNSQGNNGDLYYNTSSTTIYGPKAGGVWPAGVSLVGPQGNPGSGGSTTLANNLTTTDPAQGLAAPQGKNLKDAADALTTTVNNHTANSGIHVSAADRSKWDDMITTTRFVSYTTSLANDLSNRVTTTAFANYTATVTTALQGKEPGLGNPPVDGYMLISTAAGQRSWVAPPTSGTSTGGTSEPTTNWTISSLQAAADANTSTTKKTVIVVNNEVVIGSTSYQARSGIELRSTNKKGWLHATLNQPAIEYHGTVTDTKFRSLSITNTLVASALQSHAGCAETYQDAIITRTVYEDCFFRVKTANMNAISAAPYSPTAVGGNGVGNVQKDFYFTNCVGDSIGRGFFEVTTHIQDDGKRDVLFQNLYVTNFTGKNFGYLSTDNPLWGAGFSISGPSWNTNYTDLYLENVTYAGVEGVAARDMTVKNLTAASTNGNFFSPIALSATVNLGIRCKDVVVENCSGTALGRFVSAQDVDRLTIRGGVATTAGRNSFDRVTGLKIKTVNWTVNRGTQYNVNTVEGGNVAFIKDCPDLEITDSDFTLSNGAETNFSALQTAGSTSGVMEGGSVKRPSGANDDAVVTRDTPGMSVINTDGTPTVIRSTNRVTPYTLNLTYRQLNVATTAGSNLTITHNFGVNTAIDRVIGYEAGSRVSVDIPFDVSSVTDTQVTIIPSATTTYTSIIILGQKIQ